MPTLTVQPMTLDERERTIIHAALKRYQSEVADDIIGADSRTPVDKREKHSAEVRTLIGKFESPEAAEPE